MTKTRKNIPWRGWKQAKPGFHEKSVMLRTCGKKCFLGTKKSFPVCTKNTCKINPAGVYAAYVRARQYRSRGRKYSKVAAKAKRWLTKKHRKR
jgi:hypothetical protein